jgi:type III pantothenate kinase
MLLVVNVGNSSTSFGVHGAGGWQRRWRIHTDAARTADEHAVLFDGLLAAARIEPAGIDGAVIGSVVPQLTGVLAEVTERIAGRPPFVVTPRVQSGLRFSIDNPFEIGTDLLADAVAGFRRLGTSCVVVDFGTALTFTGVTASGVLEGVAIAPGIAYATEALAEHTAQLPVVSLTPPPTAIGRNTIHSIQSGVVFGYVGLVEGLVERFRRELPAPVGAIATGGQADLVAPLTKCFAAVDPWLTLDGLRLISELN